jgi:hypothetical protein
VKLNRVIDRFGNDHEVRAEIHLRDCAQLCTIAARMSAALSPPAVAEASDHFLPVLKAGSR